MTVCHPAGIAIWACKRQLRDRGFLGPVLKHDLYQRTVWLVPLPGSPPGAKVVS